MAQAIEEGAIAEGIETSLQNVAYANMEELDNADAIAIGSPNYNHAMMPTVQRFLNNIGDMQLSGKIGLAFGSYGWSMEAIDGIDEKLCSYGMEMLQHLKIKRMPGDEELEECRKAGSLLASKIKQRR